MAERQLLRRILPRDGVFVDIGANVAFTRCGGHASQRGGPRHRAGTQPCGFARLRFNLDATRQNGAQWPQVDALPLGVHACAAKVELHLDPNNLGGSSLYQRKTPANGWGAGHSVRIYCQPLLMILHDLGVSHVDVLKIDIEGAEDLALIPFLRDARRRPVATLYLHRKLRAPVARRLARCSDRRAATNSTPALERTWFTGFPLQSRQFNLMLNWIIDLMNSMGYFAIVFLMFLETCFRRSLRN